MANPTETKAWAALEARCAALRGVHMRELFAEDPARASRYRASAAGIDLDFSRHRLDDTTLALLLDLAREMDVPRWRERMVSGEPINVTERRAVLHVALRDLDDAFRCRVGGARVHPAVRGELDRLREFSEAVRSGAWRGHTGRPLRDVVHLGIGGSDLGPRMVCTALEPLRDGPRVRFVANVDGHALDEALRAVDPETTLFVVASKTFTTQETLTNAHTAREWFLASGAAESAVARHFVALSTNADAVRAFGIDETSMFRFWDWVGGRYSLWSAIGLPIALAVGMDRFESLLAGAHAMDRHFLDAPLERNLPVILAVLGIWYDNFLGCTSHAVVPYDHRLRLFTPFLQQLDMESNGKGVTRDGTPVSWATGPVIWGGVGTDAQHAFFQHLHQGTQVVPVDFLLVDRPGHDLAGHHRILHANALAQAEALCLGRDPGESVEPHRAFDGNRPSSVLKLEALDAAGLGALVALYEHKVFVQGTIWGINPFDQWGVELGKAMTAERLGDP
ncbi:MAG: glucose-6-phosphate isomerase [Gammaproteobacteria bacterium]|nr:glucose-6-phosphate isomerase [Gammaproteobacteria bacterium]